MVKQSVFPKPNVTSCFVHNPKTFTLLSYRCKENKKYSKDGIRILTLFFHPKLLT